MRVTDHTADTSDGRSALPRVVWMLLVGRAVNRLGAFSLTFLVLLLTQEHGWSVGNAGFAVSAFGLATIPSRLLGGQWADRFGRRTTIVLGLLGCAASQCALAAVSWTWAVLGSIVALGLCYEIYEPASQALIADLVDGPEQLRAHTAMAAALTSAGAMAGVLAALLASVDLRWLFVADAVSCLAAAAVLGFALPRDAPRGSTPQQAEVRGPSLCAPWRDRQLLALLVVQTVFAIVYLQAAVALPLTIHERGLPTWLLGVLMCVSAVTMVLAQPVIRTRRVHQWSSRTRLTAGFVVMALGVAGYASATSPWSLILSTAIVSCGDLLLMGQLLTLAGQLAPADRRARYLAVFGTSWGYAAVVAPLAGTGMLAVFGPTGTWATLAVVVLGLAAAASRCLPKRVRGTVDTS